VHLLTAADGLRVLTRDDAPSGDALELLINDSPMTNLVCADRPFEINQQTVSVQAPVVVLSSTDGCFGYVQTPAHYEYLLLRTLSASASMREWAERMLAELKGFTGDDASLSVAAVGFRSFDELRDAMGPRYEALTAEHWQPFADLDGEDVELFNERRRASWERYRSGYEAFLPEGASRAAR
jgi:hypothetical protein